MIYQVAPGIHKVEVPIPIPLRHTNCYLLEGATGWTIIDCGFHDQGAEVTWPKAFAQLGINPHRVEQIVLTHHHPDHYGASGWLSKLTGAPVRMYYREAALVEQFWHHGHGEVAAAIEMMIRHGGPEPLARGLAEHFDSQLALLLPHPEIITFGDDEPIRMGWREFQVYWLPGHSDGLPVFWCAEDRLLIAGDMILAGISPNVSWLPNSRPNPLQDFLASLARLRELPATLTLTGHRADIKDLAGRADELLEHHRQRLARVEKIVAAAGNAGITAWAVGQELFGPQPTIHNTRFAMVEGLAHLEYLTRSGRLQRTENSLIRYCQ